MKARIGNEIQLVTFFRTHHITIPPHLLVLYSYVPLYLPVNIPPANALYAIKPTFSLKGEIASATPFSSDFRSNTLKSPCIAQGGVVPKAFAVRVHAVTPYYILYTIQKIG